MKGLLDLTGEVFERLTVLREVEPTRGSQRVWLCRCTCGIELRIFQSNLRRGNTRSCGCLHREVMVKRNQTHGLHDLPEYGIWKGIRQRCLSPRGFAAKYYHDRGIEVCERWNDFANFYADMGPRPPGLCQDGRRALYSVERRDNDGPYSPENCYWATQEEQASNRRNNRRITFRGETLTVVQWARRMGVSPSTIRRRFPSESRRPSHE